MDALCDNAFVGEAKKFVVDRPLTLQAHPYFSFD
jgi:hypothetical protein